MSCVYFHSFEHKNAILRGCERAYAGLLTIDLLMVSLGKFDIGRDSTFCPSAMREILPDDWYGFDYHGDQFAYFFNNWITVSNDYFDLRDGTRMSPRLAAFNTAIRMGNDAIKLLTRIDGACELFGYIMPENHAWFAELIIKGREQNILREDVGWEDVVELFRKKSEYPIVMSFSVCDQFPTHRIFDWCDPLWEDAFENEWDNLSFEDRWHRSWAGLQSYPKAEYLELKPDGWDDFSFTENNISGFELIQIAKSLQRKRTAEKNDN